MYILKAIGELIINGELEKHELYITAPTISECFEKLVKCKGTSNMYIKVDGVYLV